MHKYINIGTVRQVVAATVAVVGLSPSVAAAPINGTGLVKPDVIFGTDNANGSFTGVSASGVELGLRGKLRFNSIGEPENTFNYNGVRTYSFDTATSNPQAGWSAFNFEWSINVDVLGQNPEGQNALGDYSYRLDIDVDPSLSTEFLTFMGLPIDPINVDCADHAIGNNSTGNGAGTSADCENDSGTGPDDYQSLIGSENVAQNSANMGFFTAIAPDGFDPQAEGQFTIGLTAFLGFDEQRKEVASTSIDIFYGEIAPVPLPAGLPLLLAGLGGFAVLRRRHRA